MLVKLQDAHIGRGLQRGEQVAAEGLQARHDLRLAPHRVHQRLLLRHQPRLSFLLHPRLHSQSTVALVSGGFYASILRKAMWAWQIMPLVFLNLPLVDRGR